MPSNERWLDAEAGPVVRPYALTRGRTRHSGEAFDLVATVTGDSGAVEELSERDSALVLGGTVSRLVKRRSW